jgi:signal transduction histidine kinase
MVPDLIVILNAERQIIFANRALLKFLQLNDDTSILGLRPGEMLDCVNAENDSGGCGTTEFCSVCGAVNSILHTQKFHQDSRRECQIITTRDKAYNFRIWTTPFEMKNCEYTLLVIRDIADEVYRSSLEHIFFHDLINIGSGLYGLLNMINGNADAYREHQQLLVGLANELLEEISSQRDLLAAEQGLMSVKWEQVNSIKAMQFAIDALAGNQVAEDRNMVLDETSEAFELKTDSRLLKRILVNMVKNALEASSSGASVVLKCTRNDHKAIFEVHNDVYIEKDVQLQIFNRSFSTKGRGRGLGTYSAKLLAEDYLQGRVYFTSTEADGTSFFVELPLQPEISDE